MGGDLMKCWSCGQVAKIDKNGYCRTCGIRQNIERIISRLERDVVLTKALFHQLFKKEETDADEVQDGSIRTDAEYD
jgi:hypothetical protein